MGKRAGAAFKAIFNGLLITATLIGQFSLADIREQPMFEILYVGQVLRNEVIEFGEILNLQKYDGYEIASVEVEATARSSNARLELVIDGNVEDREYYPNGQIELHPYMNQVLGVNAFDVELKVKGRVHVESIKISMVRLSGCSADLVVLR